MGCVYLGEHIGIGKTVAIKVLHAQLGRSKEATQRFQREAMASGRLDHPNIVSVSDFGVLADGSLYLVMEALEGEPLGTRLVRDKRIPWQEALAITRGVLAGLRHAHDRGVVHRDIKPDNIFLARKDDDQIVKILDFGIAKLYAGNADDPATTRAGLTVGTPAYLSPEQAVGGAITPASDLYSMSVVLYEMVAGRAPYEDSDPLQMLTAHVSREPPMFAEIAPDLAIPPGIEDVVRRGLAKIAAERIGSAIEYARLLEPFGGSGARLTGAAWASASLMIPMGPHAQALVSTPVPGELSAVFGAATPVTPPSLPPLEVQSLGVAPTAAAMATVNLGPPKHRALSIADLAPPIPRTWLAIGALVVVAAVVLALVAMARSHPTTLAPPPASHAAAAPLAPAPDDHVVRVKAALHDLEDGKTCADRKAAIPVLVELHDPSVVPALKRARYRGTGGVAGFGESNANACLRAEADAAIKALEGAPSSPSR